MNILFVKKLYSPVGGSEALTHQWATRLAARGHRVRVLSLWPIYRRHGFPPSDLPIVAGRHYRAFEDGGVAVHQLAPRAGPLGKVLDILPFVNLVRRDVAMQLAGDCDVVHNVCREYTNTALAIAQSRCVPLVATPLPHPGQPFSGNSQRDFRAYHSLDGIAAMTTYEKGWYQAHGVDGDRVAVVGSGAVVAPGGDGEAFRARHGIVGPIVLFVGRQEVYKGYRAVLAAAEGVWRVHPTAHFVFVGEQSLIGRFRDPIAGYGDRRVHNMKVLGEQEKADAYAACDVFCMPSTHETLGLTYLEAWSYGKPVIGGNIPPLREVIGDGVDGILVEQRAGEVGDAIVRLLSDPALARGMGEAGKQKVAAQHDWATVIGRLESLYRQVASR